MKPAPKIPRERDDWDRQFETDEGDRLVRRAVECLRDAMVRNGVTKSDLARRAGLDKGYISKIFNGTKEDFQLRTIATLAYHIGVKFYLTEVPLGLNRGQANG